MSKQVTDENRFRRRKTVWRYIQSVVLVLLATLISIPVHYVIEPENLVMFYLAAVVLVAVFLGRGPSILASILSVLAFDFFLVEPRLSLTVADTQYLLTFFGLLAVGLVISTTVAQLRNQVEIIRQREAHTAALNSLSQDLTGAVQLDDMLRSVVRHIEQSFHARVIVLLPDENKLRLAADTVSDGSLADSEYAQALAVYRGEKAADDNALQEPDHFTFLPLRTSYGPVGVLGVESKAGKHSNPAQRELLQGFANLAALAIERARLAEQASQTQVLKNTERLQDALLSSISHELRTPLVSITGALSSLIEVTEEMESAQPAAREELLETAYGEARRLNQLVGNLLDMSRLESGALRLFLEPCDPQDLIGISLERFSERQVNRIVQTRLEENLPLLNLDVALMVQVLVNLLENAAKYSPEASPIELACALHDTSLEITVCDHGPGIPEEDLERVFDKFYRAPHSRQIAGLGLGLSIAKGIVEAHGGSIRAQNQEPGGLMTIIELPVQVEAGQG
jgi:two-component system, OmpR family, sensor histidine kinase KdpD